MQLAPPQIANPHDRQGRNHSDAFRPTGALAETYSRSNVTTAQTVLTSGRLMMTAIYLPAGTVVSTISSFTGTTALSGSITHQHFSLYSSSRAKLAVTADDGATAWGASAEKKLYVSRMVTDAVASSGTAVITSATAAFTASDVGKQITFMGAGAAGVPLGTSASRVTILSVDSATQITVSANAGTSVASGGTLFVATPYTTPTDGLYYLGEVVNATVGTKPTLNLAASQPHWALAPVLAGDSTSGITTGPAGLPDPAASIGVNWGPCYYYVA